jgi:hypothetical protein
MRKTFVKTLAMSAGILGAAAFSETTDIRTHYMKACDYWTHDRDSNGYVCSHYPTSVSVADANSTSTEIRELKAQIQSLEKRIAELEGKAP